MSNILLYGPQGSGKSQVAQAIADMFGLRRVIEAEGGLFQATTAEPALVVRESDEAPARNLAQAYGFRTVMHVEDARRLLKHAFDAPSAHGLEVVDGSEILKGNADLSPEEIGRAHV